MYRNERLYVRLSEGDLAVLDGKRGGFTRSAFIRWLITHDDGHPHPEPHPEPVDPPIPSPISPPVPPPNPVETFTPPVPTAQNVTVVDHHHDWVQAGSMFNRCTICDERTRR